MKNLLHVLIKPKKFVNSNNARMKMKNIQIGKQITNSSVRISLALLLISIMGCASLKDAIDENALPSHSKWILTFEDEFNGKVINESKWKVYNGKSGHIASNRYKDNIKIENGLLRLITKKEVPPKEGKDWSSGHIWTKHFKQKYGYFVARYRYANASGLNNAFWLFTGVKKEIKDKCFEIDINEGHYPNEIAMNVHYWKGKHVSFSKKWFAKGCNLGNEFHTYALEWSPKKLIWYFDGKVIREMRNKNSNLPAPIYFSTAVSKSIQWVGPITDALDGASMDVDWVKIYKRALSPPQINSRKISTSDINCTSVRLNWKKADDDATTSKELLYKIYYSKTDSLDNLINIKKHGIVIKQLKGTQEYLIKNLSHSTNYTINILVEDKAGDHAIYKEVKFKTTNSKDKTRPIAKDKSIISPTRDSTSITISWIEANDNITPKQEIKYSVYASKKPNIGTIENAEKNGQLLITTNLKKYRIKDLKHSENYYVNVIASDKVGNKIEYKMATFSVKDNETPPIYHLAFKKPATFIADSRKKYKNAEIFGGKFVRNLENGNGMIELNGIDDYIKLPPLNINSNHVTISILLCKIGKQKSFAGIIFSRKKEVAGLQCSSPEVGSSENITYRWSGGAPWQWNSKLLIPSNKFIRLTLVITPENAIIYINDPNSNKLQKRSYKIFHEKMSLNNLEIGRDSHKEKNGKTRNFKGLIEDLKIYNRALSESEVKKIK